jgi:hypothetical protein
VEVLKDNERKEVDMRFQHHIVDLYSVEWEDDHEFRAKVEAVMLYFTILSQHLPGRKEENHKTHAMKSS